MVTQKQVRTHGQNRQFNLYLDICSARHFFFKRYLVYFTRRQRVLSYHVKSLPFLNICLYSRPKFFQQLMSNCYNDYTVNNNNTQGQSIQSYSTVVNVLLSISQLKGLNRIFPLLVPQSSRLKQNYFLLSNSPLKNILYVQEVVSNLIQ